MSHAAVPSLTLTPSTYTTQEERRLKAGALVVLLLLVLAGVLAVLLIPKKHNPPQQPQAVRAVLNSNYQWVLLWDPPSGGTPPITYGYAVTSASGQVLLSGITAETQVALPFAQPNTTYGVQLEAINPWGHSGVVQTNVTTLGPPVPIPSTIQVGFNSDANNNYFVFSGSTDKPITAAVSSLQIGQGGQVVQPSSPCSTTANGGSGWSCSFTVPIGTNVLGVVLLFSLTIANKFGSSTLSPPYMFRAPGFAPTAPLNVRLNV